MRCCLSSFFGIYWHASAPISIPSITGQDVYKLHFSSLELRSWMSCRFSKQMYAWKFGKAEWRQIPAFYRQEWAVAGLHIPTFQSLIPWMWGSLTATIWLLNYTAEGWCWRQNPSGSPMTSILPPLPAILGAPSSLCWIPFCLKYLE